MADLPGLQWGTSVSAINWPDVKYFTDRGIPENKAKALAGQPINIQGLTGSDSKKYLSAIVQVLGPEDANKFFGEFSSQGFKPSDILTTKKATSTFKQFGTLLPVLQQGGFAKLNPNDVNLATGTVKTPTPVQTAGGQTVVGGNAAGTSAYSIMAQNLANWGMEDLIPKVYDYVFNKGVTNGRQLLTAIRAEPEYKKTFAGLDEYNRTNPQPITEAQYLATAQKYREIADMYGLPPSFFTRQEVGKLIAGGVSAAEFNRRLSNGYQVAANADEATKKYLAQQGVDMGHLLAYYLDPKKAEPLLTQKATTAQLQGYAQNVGVRDFSTAMAQELARRAKSAINSDGTFSSAQEQKALDVAGAGAGLTGNAPGANAPTVNTAQLIGSQLEGFGGTTQPEAQLAVQRAVQGQAAPFQSGGGYETTQRGVTGVGSAQQ